MEGCHGHSRTPLPMADSLLLWDIDGTLVSMDRAGERALLLAIRELYQRELGDLPVDLRGRTDTSISRELLAYLGLPGHAEEARRFQLAYLSHLPATMPAGKARVLTGIREALDAVHAHPEIHQALLTGNLREGARLKLSFLGLWIISSSALSPMIATSAMNSGRSPWRVRRKNWASISRPSASGSSATRPTISPAARPSAQRPSPSRPARSAWRNYLR